MDPLVCAVMVTGKPGREYLARKAIAAFLAQTYVRKRLVIINDGERLLQSHTPSIVEVQAEPGLSLGELRNKAIELMPDDVNYLVQWDDDDYSHPSRIKWQLANTPPGMASVLRYEVHGDMRSRAIKLCMPTKMHHYGFAGTLMHPLPTNFRYPAKAKGEDSRFVKQWRENNQLKVIVNTDRPAMYLRIFHGKNTWDAAHVMGFPRAPVPLATTERHRVLTVLDDYINASAKSCNHRPAAP